MGEKILPNGMAWINMNGQIKYVARHLAYDKQLQKLQKFFLCDENGAQISQPESEALPTGAEKKSQAVEVVEEIKPTIDIPAGVELINPLEEEAETATQPKTEEPQTDINAPKKRGRKPKNQ